MNVDRACTLQQQEEDHSHPGQEPRHPSAMHLVPSVPHCRCPPAPIRFPGEELFIGRAPGPWSLINWPAGVGLTAGWLFAKP